MLGAGQPAGPFHVTGGHPAGHPGIRVSPLGRNVVLALEFHDAEFHPDPGLVVAGIDAEDGVVFLTQVAADILYPQFVTVPFQSPGGLASVGGIFILAVFV